MNMGIYFLDEIAFGDRSIGFVREIRAYKLYSTKRSGLYILIGIARCRFVEVSKQQDFLKRFFIYFKFDNFYFYTFDSYIYLIFIFNFEQSLRRT